MDAGFIQYLAEQRGFRPGDTIATKQQYDAMYKQYLKDTSGGGADFTPSTGMATNAVSQEVTPYFMSSPNSAQPMVQRSSKQLSKGKDGKAYTFDPLTGEVAPAIIKGTTNQYEMDPKSNALADALAQMAGPQGAAATEPSGIASFFNFGGGAPAASPTPSPTPEATPEATPMPAMAGTNAPVPVAAPALSTPEAVRAAFLAGQISEAQAVQMLRGGR